MKSKAPKDKRAWTIVRSEDQNSGACVFVLYLSLSKIATWLKFSLEKGKINPPEFKGEWEQHLTATEAVEAAIKVFDALKSVKTIYDPRCPITMYIGAPSNLFCSPSFWWVRELAQKLDKGAKGRGKDDIARIILSSPPVKFYTVQEELNGERTGNEYGFFTSQKEAGEEADTRYHKKSSATFKVVELE